MDAYADALGVSAPSQAPQPSGYAGGSPEAAAPEQLRIMGEERAKFAAQGDQATVAALDREMARIRQQTGVGAAPVAAPVASAAPAAQTDPYADALGIGKPAQPIQASSAPSQPLTGKDRLAQGITQAPGQIRAVLGNQITGLGANIVGGYRGLSELLTGGTMDDAANAVRDYVSSHTYTPEKGTPEARGVESFNSPANPLTYVPRAADYLGGKVADATGSPALGAAVNTGVNAVPLLLGVRGKAGTAPVEVGPSRPGTGVYAPLGGTPATTLPTPGEPAPVVPQPVPGKPQPATTGAPAAAPAAAPATAPPAAAPVPPTTQGVQAVATQAPSALFPETPTTAPQGKFTPQQQLDRAKVLESVGMDPDKLRKSALAGDAIGGSTDFQTAKLDSPAGREMRSIIDNERQALITNADRLVQQTGGTHGVDQSALYARGNTILAPLDGLKQWFDSRISGLYQAADERAQGTPTTLGTFGSVLSDASELTNSDRVHLQTAVNAYLNKLGMVGEDGSLAGSAQQAETVRKYLNEQWSPQNSKFVGKLKDALDDDVTQSAGEDIYAQARQVRALRGQTLDNPNGIARLMDSSGPQGINRTVPVEKIPDALSGMPVDQFSHVVQTLKEAPPELQPQAQAALGEVRAQFANKVQQVGSAQAGQWNAKGVTKYLQNNAARMAQVFTPEEIQQFRNLNDAGHIVAKDQSYPGAAVQGHNLVTQGVMSTLPSAGAAAGGFIAGAPGAAVGAAAGRMAAGAVENAATMRAVRKRTTKLSDLLKTK